MALAVAQVGSLFSADAWNNIGFTAAEVKNPKRDVALSMAFGTIIVIYSVLPGQRRVSVRSAAGADSECAR